MPVFPSSWFVISNVESAAVRQPAVAAAMLPVASCMTASSLSSSRRSSSRVIRPSCITSVRSDIPRIFFHLAADKQNGDTLFGQPFHQRVDLLFGLISMPRWLIKQQHLWLHRQPLAKHHLLLISPERYCTICRSSGVLMRSFSIIVKGCRAFHIVQQRYRSSDAASVRPVRCSFDGHFEQFSPCCLRSSGTSAMPAAIASRGLAMRYRTGHRRESCRQRQRRLRTAR